jgi:hypothetical protein
MAVSKYFKHGAASEQGLQEDLVIESIQHRGMDLLYIPRTVVDVNEFFSEDRFSTYDEVFEIEMYPINQTGYEGQGDLLSKFGIQVDHTGTFIVARKRWLAESTKVSSLQLPNRPAEGDLLYYPLSKSLFKINHVEPNSPFFQLLRNYIWELKVSLVDYTYNELNTGNDDVDNIFGDLRAEMIDGEPVEGQRLHQGQNDTMVSKADDIIDWSASNPFGEK